MTLPPLPSPSFLPALLAGTGRLAGRAAAHLPNAGLHRMARWLAPSPVVSSRGTLEAGETRRWVAGRPWRLQVTAGRAWITWAGETDDVFLDAGGVLDVPADRELLVGAETALQWRTEPAPAAVRPA